MFRTLSRTLTAWAVFAASCVFAQTASAQEEPELPPNYGGFVSVEGTKLKVKMQDKLWDAVVTCDSPYDPKNETIRKDG